MQNFIQLESQCKEVGWPIQVIKANYLGESKLSNNMNNGLSPEEVVATNISAEGYECCWCEGGSINLLMKAAALDVLSKLNVFESRSDAVQRYFEAQCTILKEFDTEIIDCIREVTDERLKENIAEIFANPNTQQAYTRVSENFLLLLSSKIIRDLLVNIAKTFICKPYEYRSGWPDLTIIEKNGISFVEVKTTDLLHESQIRFATEVAQPLGLVCRLVRVE